MKFTVNLPDDPHARLKRLVDRRLAGHGQRVRELAGEVARRDAELLRRLAG